MARPRVILTTPYPTLDEIAKAHGIPRREVQAISAMVEEILARPRNRRLLKQYRERRRNLHKST